MTPHRGIPIVSPLGSIDPIAALRALATLPHAFLLHSGLPDERSHWSFFGADPFAIYRGGDYESAVAAFRDMREPRGSWESLLAGPAGPSHRVRFRSAPGAAPARRDPQASPEAPAAHEIPFTGGAVGYWAYDLGRRLERLPSLAADDLRLPDFFLGFYDVVGAYDHRSQEGWLFSSGLPAEGGARRARAKSRLRTFERLLGGVDRSAVERTSRAAASFSLEQARCTFIRDAYLRAIEGVKEHIRRGDIFQANLSQRWALSLEHAPPGVRAATLFESLCERSPAPFAAFLDVGDHAIASASPERFLSLQGRQVEARPIKGTRPRGASAAEDARLGRELLASAKDRAENVMIVDVLRNDVGRVCETGSVETPVLCELETFPQVHHLTSTVTGRLGESRDAFDLLHACFPGGSITGAPKIRAMELLEAIEPVRRHIYTGSLGYLDWRGHADWSIAIRTVLVTPERLCFSAGGGITADSDPEAEYQETLHKAEGMRTAIEHAGIALPARPRVHA